MKLFRLAAARHPQKRPVDAEESDGKGCLSAMRQGGEDVRGAERGPDLCARMTAPI